MSVGGGPIDPHEYFAGLFHRQATGRCLPAHGPKGDLDMRTLWQALIALRRKTALTPEQAEQLARIKFPCC
jgi:hypothetical protein